MRGAFFFYPMDMLEEDEVERLCEMLKDLRVDGMLISPGYHYESVDRDVFLTVGWESRLVRIRARN